MDNSKIDDISILDHLPREKLQKIFQRNGPLAEFPLNENDPSTALRARLRGSAETRQATGGEPALLPRRGGHGSVTVNFVTGRELVDGVVRTIVEE